MTRKSTLVLHRARQRARVPAEGRHRSRMKAIVPMPESRRILSGRARIARGAAPSSEVGKVSAGLRAGRAFDPKAAVSYGRFVQAAYTMYNADPSNLTPPQSNDARRRPSKILVAGLNHPGQVWLLRRRLVFRGRDAEE